MSADAVGGPRGRRWWYVAAGVLSLVVCGLVGYGVYARLRPAQTVDFSTPPPADLTAPIPDPNDVENIPSLQEARQYLMISTRKGRKVTGAEFERMLALSRFDRYDLTAKFAMNAAAASLDQVDDEPACRAKLLAVFVENLKSASAPIRLSSIHGIGNLQAKDQAPLVLPFLKSADPKEQEAARLTLEKLGYVPPRTPGD